MAEPPAEPRRGESGGLVKGILAKLGDGVVAILTANETLKSIRDEVGRLQGQLIQVIGSSSYQTAKIEDLERRLAEAEAENRQLRERIEAVERAQQYQAGRADEAAKRSG